MNKFLYHLSLLITLSVTCIACSRPLVEASPEFFTDTDKVTITVNAEKGNKGLLGHQYPVYVHLGLITDSSVHPSDWRYLKFKWGSVEEAALAKKEGENIWSYTIPNIRQFFGVKDPEKPMQLAILFRQGNCFDTQCKVLRNEDGTDFMIPIKQGK